MESLEGISRATSKKGGYVQGKYHGWGRRMFVKDAPFTLMRLPM